ncbi:MAG TPA: hypothetical protein VNG90_02435 [Candidatus Acidoferrum sp.]|nr:hypothetical protein [Candidatus Acidoferrum sp.]
MALSIGPTEITATALNNVVRTFRLLAHDAGWEVTKYLLNEEQGVRMYDTDVKIGGRQRSKSYTAKTLAQLGMLSGGGQTYWLDQEMYAIFKGLYQALGNRAALQAVANAPSLYVLLRLWVQRPKGDSEKLAIAAQVKQQLNIDDELASLNSVQVALGLQSPTITKALEFARQHQIIGRLIIGNGYCFCCDVAEKEIYRHIYAEHLFPNDGPIVAEAAAKYFLLLCQRMTDSLATQQ